MSLGHSASRKVKSSPVSGETFTTHLMKGEPSWILENPSGVIDRGPENKDSGLLDLKIVSKKKEVQHE